MRVVFSDGEIRDVDVEPLLDGPVFGPLRERTMFERVGVDDLGDTITWPTGADLDPDVLYGTAPGVGSHRCGSRSASEPELRGLLQDLPPELVQGVDRIPEAGGSRQPDAARKTPHRSCPVRARRAAIAAPLLSSCQASRSG